LAFGRSCYDFLTVTGSCQDIERKRLPVARAKATFAGANSAGRWINDAASDVVAGNFPVEVALEDQGPVFIGFDPAFQVE
jgi:hypothetical protein